MSNDSAPGSSQPRDAQPRRAYSIGLLLSLIALVPLLGAGWFAVGEIRTSSSARTQAASVDASVTRLIQLTELRTRLLDERNWTSAEGGMTEIGVTPEFVLNLTGIDVATELNESRSSVDRLIGELGYQELFLEVEEIRRTDDLDLTEIAQ